MKTIRDTLLGEEVRFHFAEGRGDLSRVAAFISRNPWLGIDTESTTANCYRRGWRLKTWQCANDVDSFVVPAKWKSFIWWAMQSNTQWVGHNLPHDIRSIDQWLGKRTRVTGADTYIPAHHLDSRGKDEGGTGHKLEELAKAYISSESGKWDAARKEAFKQLTIDVSGEVYKSGPKRGQQKTRKARYDEGWALIDIAHPAMIAYAGADPLLTYRLWRKFQPTVRENYELYQFDRAVQEGYDELQRRAIKLDVHYTERLSDAYAVRSAELRKRAADYGCQNIQSGDQIADTLIELGVKLRAKTDSGKWKTDAELLRKIMDRETTPLPAKRFIKCVLGAKQVEKRRASYTEAMLKERDSNDRVHPSIRSLAARTTRSSVSGPALQQLPTQDHANEEDFE